MFRLRSCAGIGSRLGAQVQFIVIGDGLAFSGEHDGMVVDRALLQEAQVAIMVFGGEEFHGALLTPLQGVRIQLVDLLTKHHSLAGPANLAKLFDAERGLREIRFGKLYFWSPSRSDAGFRTIRKYFRGIEKFSFFKAAPV
jgi:hypothetical protein